MKLRNPYNYLYETYSLQVYVYRLIDWINAFDFLLNSGRIMQRQNFCQLLTYRSRLNINFLNHTINGQYRIL